MVTSRMRLRGRPAANILLLIGLFTLTACEGDDGPSSPGSGSAAIAGTVTRQKTGVGVPGLVAVLMSDGEVVATAHTDAGGSFGFGNVDAGSYTVRLTGYDIAGLDPRFDVLEPQSQSMLVPDGDGDLVFTVVGVLAPRITGAIRCGGAAAAGANVRIIGGSTDTTIAAGATGGYTLLDLEPGRYAVIAVDAPCDVSPGFHALDLRPGQAGTADFDG
jgi:hypothetical protein